MYSCGKERMTSTCVVYWVLGTRWQLAPLTSEQVKVMSTKKQLSLISDARFPSKLRGVTKTTKWNCKQVQGAIGKYHAKLYENCDHVSELTKVVSNFEDAKDAAKVFAAWRDMKAELRDLCRNAEMSYPNLKQIKCKDVKKNVDLLDNDIEAKEEELERLKCKKRAEQALLVLGESFVSASKALEVSERYSFA